MKPLRARSFAIDTDLWCEVVEEATRRNMSASAFIRTCLTVALAQIGARSEVAR